MHQQTSRREFLGISGAALAAAKLGAYQQRPAERRLFAYVGRHTTGPGFTGTKGGGVDVFLVNLADGSYGCGFPSLARLGSALVVVTPETSSHGIGAFRVFWHWKRP